MCAFSSSCYAMPWCCARRREQKAIKLSGRWGEVLSEWKLNRVLWGFYAGWCCCWAWDIRRGRTDNAENIYINVPMITSNYIENLLMYTYAASLQWLVGAVHALYPNNVEELFNSSILIGYCFLGVVMCTLLQATGAYMTNEHQSENKSVAGDFNRQTIKTTTFLFLFRQRVVERVQEKKVSILFPFFFRLPPCNWMLHSSSPSKMC